MLLVALVACAAPAPSPAQGVSPTPAAPLETASLTCPPGQTSPPTASLEAANGDDIAGVLSANSFCGGVLPTPAWDPTPTKLSDDDLNVLISIDDGPPFVAWHIEVQATSTALAPSAAGPRTLLAEGANLAGVQSLSVGGPAPGIWMLTAALTFPGQTGSATYSWMVSAP
jgi:hypothetical protein